MTHCTVAYDLAKAFNEDYDRRQEDGIEQAFNLGVALGLQRALATVKGMQEEACKRRNLLVELRCLDDVEDALNAQLDIWQND